MESARGLGDDGRIGEEGRRRAGGQKLVLGGDDLQF
jgi:hypothetical protein